MSDDREALDWAIRMSDPEAADWDAFMIWLESDALHAERYDRMASALRDAETAVVAAPVASSMKADRKNAGRVIFRQQGRWIAGAIAATLVGAVGLGVWNKRADQYVVQTRAGEQHIVHLDDGSKIILASASQLRFDRSAPRFAVVERGEALFYVRHDASHPFNVRVGDLDLTDIGTIFNVKTVDGITRIAVAEGAVIIDRDGAALRLDAGQAVIAQGEGLSRQSTEPEDVGSWREGRLAFDDVSLREVAADLSRELAIPIRVAPSIAERTFGGILYIRTVKNDPKLLGDLLGVNVRRNADGWMLEPRR